MPELGPKLKTPPPHFFVGAREPSSRCKRPDCGRRPDDAVHLRQMGHRPPRHRLGPTPSPPPHPHRVRDSMPPEWRLAWARSAYLAGHIELAEFERVAGLAIAEGA